MDPGGILSFLQKRLWLVMSGCALSVLFLSAYFSASVHLWKGIAADFVGKGKAAHLGATHEIFLIV